MSETLTLTTPVLEGSSLVLELTGAEDRRRTHVWLCKGDDRTEFLRSAEGRGTEAWPPGPPMQDMMLQPHPAAGSALPAEAQFLGGVGMAGTSHWSLLIEPAADGVGFVFDFACRVRQPPVFLGSTYEILDCHALHRDGPGVQFRVHDTPLLLTPEPDGPNCGVLAEDGSAVVRAELPVSADAESQSQSPRTIRWKYRLQLLPGSGS